VHGDGMLAYMLQRAATSEFAFEEVKE
jgi:hypothetical protein